MTDKSQRIPVLEKIGYSAADAAANFVFLTMVVFQANFYTDVMGLTAGVAALIILVARLWDAVFDPIMGIMADRTRTRWGSFRPWILFTALPWGVIMVLAYTTPNWRGGMLIAYALVTNILLMTIYSANNMPYAALGGVMTGDVNERSKLNAFRFVAVHIAQFIVGGFTLLWVAKFAGQHTTAMPNGDTAKGWQTVMLIYAVVCVVCFLITFATTKERIKAMPQKGVAKSSVRQDFSDLLRNAPWVVMFLMTFIHFAMLPLRGSAMVNYYKKYADQQALYAAIKPMGLTAKLPMFNSNAVDPANNAIDLKDAPGLSTGVKVVYRHGYDETAGLGGLTNGKVYFVRVVENGTVKLFDTEENAKGTGDKGLVTLKEVQNLPKEGKPQLVKVDKDHGDKTANLKPADLDIANNRIASLESLELNKGDKVDKVTFKYQLDVGGLVDGGTYYANVGAGGKTKLYDTKAHAQAGGSEGLVALSKVSTGSQHELVPQTILEYLGVIVHGDTNDLGHSTVGDVAFGLQSTLNYVVLVLGIMVAPVLGKRFGKKAIVLTGTILMGVNSFLFYFVPPSGVGWMIVLTITYAASYGPIIPLIWAIFADVVDYNEWKTGRRATGIVFATIGFALKAGLALGTAIYLWIMSANGYDQNPNSPAVVEAVHKSMSIYTGLLFVGCAILVALLSLNKSVTNKMEEDLAQRRKAAQEGAGGGDVRRN